jgi:hypothetical protein
MAFLPPGKNKPDANAGTQSDLLGYNIPCLSPEALQGLLSQPFDASSSRLKADSDEMSTSEEKSVDEPQSDEAPSFESQSSVFSEDVCFQVDDLKRYQDLASKLPFEDSATKRQILTTLGRKALHLAFSTDGAEILQKALEVACCGEEQEVLVGGLRGHVRDLASSPSGSEVLQSCLEVMPPQACRFIVDELRGMAAVKACTEEGKEVILRLLEHLPPQESSPVADELLHDVAGFCWHPCGSQVMQHMLEYGSPAQQLRICEVLMASQGASAQGISACQIVQKALECVCPDVRAQLMKVMVDRPAEDECDWLDPTLCDDAESLFPSMSGLDADALPFNPNVEVTTLMVRGIPCSLTQERLMLFLDQAGLHGKYDFFYMPRAGRSRSNLGYAFVNFVDAASSAIACSMTQGVVLDPGRSKKVCRVSPAHIQGLEELKRHFRRTAVSRGTRGPVYPHQGPSS